MALVVNTNMASLTAQNHLASNRREMETAMERLSSGLRVNKASDDAAGFAIGAQMDAQIRGLTQAVRNANDGISMVQTAAGAQTEISEMLQRMRELAVQSSNSSNNDTDRALLDAEVTQLVAEIDQIAADTRFNNQVLLDGSLNARIQTGHLTTQELDFSIASMKTGDLGLASSATVAGTNTFITDRVGLDASGTAVAAGDIKINGQDLSAISATTSDIRDVADDINTNIDGVTATAFNTVVMFEAGTGIATSGQVVIGVQNVGTGSAASDLGFQAFVIDEASSSLEELANLINIKTNYAVTTSINSEGKLVLSNTTGAGISVYDSSTGAKATGLADGVNSTETQTTASDDYDPVNSSTPATDNGRVFFGMLKLETTDGSAITIEKGVGSDSVATTAMLDVLGMTQVNVNDDLFSTYSLQNDTMLTASATKAFTAGDIKINGVDVFNSNIDTTTFEGKLSAINAVSAQTGVTASAQFERFYDLSTLIGNGAGTLTVKNAAGSTTNTADIKATVSTNYTNFSALFTAVGLSAELIGDVMRIYGDDVNYINVGLDTNGVAVTQVKTLFGPTNTTAVDQYSSIQLETTGSKGISVNLGEDITDTASDSFGFTQVNVGAADFDSNAPTSNISTQAVSSVSVASQSSAVEAINAIDAALLQVTSSAADLGATQNRLNHVVSNISETIVNTEAAKSRIMDADFAVESARLAKQQVLQQASTAMLAQANSAPQLVLSLLGG